MPRHVKRRYDTYAAHARVLDDVAYLRLRVIHPIRPHQLELRILAALDTEALILSQVPVQDVQLDGGHAVQIALDRLDGLEVPARINQQPAPTKTRLVLNDSGRDEIAAAITFEQLQKSL